MKKMLIAIDDSKGAAKAVEYVGKQYSGVSDLTITLVHVLPNLPAIFWDEGHILSDQEKKDRQKVVDNWLEKQKQKIDPVLQAAADALTAKGIKTGQITTQFISDSIDAAESILETARDGGYQTIIVGRRGITEGRHLMLGSVTSKLINLGAGVAICVVE